MRELLLSLIIFAAVVQAGCRANQHRPDDQLKIDSLVVGEFLDDYNSHYWISEASWIQDSSYAFHVVTWNTDQKYIIARNDSLNPSEAGLYSRIDYVELSMEPYTWAFCLTTYDATTAAAAEAHHSADRGNPRTGCSGFPFTRMRPL